MSRSCILPPLDLFFFYVTCLVCSKNTWFLVVCYISDKLQWQMQTRVIQTGLKESRFQSMWILKRRVSIQPFYSRLDSTSLEAEAYWRGALQLEPLGYSGWLTWNWGSLVSAHQRAVLSLERAKWAAVCPSSLTGSCSARAGSWLCPTLFLAIPFQELAGPELSRRSVKILGILTE